MREHAEQDPGFKEALLEYAIQATKRKKISKKKGKGLLQECKLCLISCLYLFCLAEAAELLLENFIRIVTGPQLTAMYLTFQHDFRKEDTRFHLACIFN